MKEGRGECIHSTVRTYLCEFPSLPVAFGQQINLSEASLLLAVSSSFGIPHFKLTTLGRRGSVETRDEG